MDAIIFDMDGTMVDNMMVHHRAWQKTLKSLGLDWDLEKIRQEVHGVNIEILTKLFGDRFSAEERIQISKEKEILYRQIYKPDLKLISGLEIFLDKLADMQMPLVIGSAAPPGNVNFVLDELNLRSRFKHVMHSESVKNGKPHPEIYLKLSELLGVNPESCIVFEDSPVGARTAANAGCPSVIITTTHTQAEFDGIPGIVKFIENYNDFDLDSIKN